MLEFYKELNDYELNRCFKLNLDVIIVYAIKYMDVKFFISKVSDINQFEIIIFGDFFGFKFFWYQTQIKNFV